MKKKRKGKRFATWCHLFFLELHFYEHPETPLSLKSCLNLFQILGLVNMPGKRWKIQKQYIFKQQVISEPQRFQFSRT